MSASPVLAVHTYDWELPVLPVTCPALLIAMAVVLVMTVAQRSIAGPPLRGHRVA
jgi:hypothetical protein